MSARSTGTLARALGSMMFVQVICTLSIQTVPVLAPAAAGELGLDASLIGFFGAIMFFGTAVMSLASSRFVLGYGPLRACQAGMAACGAGLVLVTGAYWPLFAACGLCIGIAYGLPTPASSHLLARHTPPRFMALVFSIKQTGVPIGGAAAGLLVPVLVDQFGWRGAAVAVAVICVTGAVLIQPLRAGLDADRKKGTAPFHPRDVIEPIKLVLRQARLREIAMCSLAFSAMQQVVNIFLVTYLASGIGLSLTQAGLALSVALGAAVPGRILWGVLADRLGGRRVLGGLSLAMTGAAVAAASFTPDWPFPAMLAVCGVFGATAFGWNGVFLAEIARIVPQEEASRATGGMLFVAYISVVVAPVLFSTIVATTGSYAAAMFLLASFTLVAGIVMLRPWPEQAGA